MCPTIEVRYTLPEHLPRVGANEFDAEIGAARGAMTPDVPSRSGTPRTLPVGLVVLALQPLLAGVVPFDPAAIVSSGPGTSQPRGVHAADLDGDGDLDVVTASFGDGTVSWHENDGGDPPAFTPHVISSSAPGASSVFVADVDRDGALDVLSASADDDTIAWYENMLPSGFTRHVVASDALGAASVFAADLDGDGDIDLLSASESDDRIAWYESDGAGVSGTSSFP